MKRRDWLWIGLVLVIVALWVVDHQIQGNHADLLRRQMDRYYWQADRLAWWIGNSDGVKHIDVNYDMIAITTTDERTHRFSRVP